MATARITAARNERGGFDTTANCPQCQRRNGPCPPLYQQHQQEKPFDCDGFLQDPQTCTKTPSVMICYPCMAYPECGRRAA